MKYLFIKMRRDIMSMWVQFFSVFMMSLLAITIYSGMEGVWYGLQSEVDKYYIETNLADVWVNGSNITDDMIERILEYEGVDQIEKSMTLTVGVETQTNDKPDIKLLSMDSINLFNPKIMDGQEFDKNSADGIWLDKSMANERNINVGDYITLQYNNVEMNFVIKGLILDSEFIYYTGSITDTVPNHTLHGYGLISSAAAQQFYTFTICNEIRLAIKDDCKIDELQREVEDILGDSYYSFLQRDDISSVSQIIKEIKQMQNMANLFSAVFILLALLSMYTTMTRLVNTQIVQIGTMKALGYSNFAIRLHYVFYGLFVSLMGGLLGTVFGKLLVSRAVMRVKKATLTMSVWQVRLSYRTFLIIAGIVLICMLATIFATRKGLNKLPSETMRASTAGSGNKKSIFNPENIRIWNKVEYNTKWMIRDILQNKVRWIMSIIGIAGSMVLMMAGFGFRDSINFSNNYVYNKQYTYNYKVVLSNNYSEEGFALLMDSINHDNQLLYETAIEMYYLNGNDKETRTISVIDVGDFVDLETLDNKQLDLALDTVAISKKIAQNLGVKEGDTIKCRILGDKDYISLVVTDILIAPSPQGIFLSSDLWEKKLNRPFVASSILLSDDGDYEIIKDMDVVKDIKTIDEQLESMKIMTKSVLTIIYLLIVASVLLASVIIYNLGMLNYIERYREYATMKVLGFYQNEIRNIIIRDCVITTIIGWFLGVPIGYKFLSFYIGIVQFKSFEWVPTLSTISFIIASVSVIMCSVVVNLVVAHKVVGISMVESLKSVE